MARVLWELSWDEIYSLSDAVSIAMLKECKERNLEIFAPGYSLSGAIKEGIEKEYTRSLLHRANNEKRSGNVKG